MIQSSQNEHLFELIKLNRLVSLDGYLADDGYSNNILMSALLILYFTGFKENTITRLRIHDSILLKNY